MRKTYEWLVDAAACDTDECLIWPFGANTGGKDPHGRINIGGKWHVTSRLVCEWHWGPPPSDNPFAWLATHGPCDSALCCNWRHLSWKDPAGNAADRLRDGTDCFGAKNPWFGKPHARATLTADDVHAIRAQVGASNRELAVVYGVHPDSISAARNRKTWKHIQ